MMCVALKNFMGAGEDIVRNQLIDGGIFRNEQTLINQRFIRPATKEEIETARFEPAEPEPTPVRRKLKARIRKSR